MAARKPILHARDHMPGGADELDWSAAGGGGSALPGLDTVLVDLGADHLWKFDEASGATAHDAIGGKDLAGTGGTITWGGPASPPGTASVLSNATRWTAAAGIPPLSNTFSAGVWVHNASPGSSQAVIGQAQPIRSIGASATGWEILLAASGSKPGVVLGNPAGGNATVLANAALIASAWTLLGFTIDASHVCTMYVNGVAQAAPQTLAFTTYSGADTWFGSDASGGIVLYDGHLAWGFIFQTEALTADQWAAIYAGSFPFAGDAQVLTADGAGGTKWRTAAGSGGIVVTATGTELVIDGSALAGAGGVFGPPAATDPTGLGTGDAGYQYFNTTHHKLRVWTGTGWEELTSTSSVAIEPPAVTSFTPTTGADGTAVTITGTGFTGATDVKFHGTSVSSFTVVSDTSITTHSPTGTTTGTVSVITPLGTGTSSGVFTPSASYASTILADSPVAYWKLDEASGSSFADATGNGHTATTRSGGTVTAGDLSSPTGHGATFGGGSNDMIQAPDSSALDVTGDVTYECWIKTPFTATGDGGYQMVMSKGATSPNFGYSLRTNPTRHLEFLKHNSAVLATSSGQVPNDNAWHYIAVTRSGNTFTFYIDGSSAGTGSSSTTVSDTPNKFSIGSSVAGSDVPDAEPFGGKMADVALYNSALSSTQIAAHYAAA